MKKIFTSAITFALALVMLFTFTACAEIEGGSKIQRMKMEIEFCDASNTAVDTRTVEIKLYETFAKETVDFFVKLAEDGYYNGTCISNVNSAWCEFGEYEYVEGVLTKKTNNYEPIKGEFKANGYVLEDDYVGLTSSSGALIMKRNYDTNDGVSQYNTAKGAVIMNFYSNATFSSDKYCVFGMVCSDDAPETSASSSASSTTTSTSTVDRSTMSSLQIVQSIMDYRKKDEVTTYYYQTKNEYYTTFVDDDSVTHYYKGTEMTDANEITDTVEVEDFKELMSDDSEYFLAIPYTHIIIKSITKA